MIMKDQLATETAEERKAISECVDVSNLAADTMEESSPVCKISL